MFFAYPDYINLGSRDEEDALKNLGDLFTPLPFSKIDNIETMYKYIVMFVQPPSKINKDANTYKYDSFDIYSHDGDENAILPTFKKKGIQQDLQGPNVSDHDLQCSRYGYNVPAFGVEYARQNNAIFKNISVGMQNPIQTDQSINALSLIAERGRGAGKRTIFYGQDLYTVYQGYSYTATIQMMGNAQIMPMMYFQLFNVPMFRGSYMIYSVQHTMRPGDMTTTIKAMKMSKHTLPWCKEWYKDYWFDEYGNVVDGEDDICGGSSEEGKELKKINGNYHVSTQGHTSKILSGTGKDKIPRTKNDESKKLSDDLKTQITVKIRTSQTGVKDKTITINKNLIDEYRAIFECIYNGKDKDGKDAKINGKYFEIHGIADYSYRNTQGGGKPESAVLSNHSYGIAIDINPGDNPYSLEDAVKKSKVDTERYIRTKDHPVVRIFAQYGFGWGGRYNDFMHFSYLDGN
jgi:hypothetical protein